MKKISWTISLFLIVLMIFTSCTNTTVSNSNSTVDNNSKVTDKTNNNTSTPKENVLMTYFSNTPATLNPHTTATSYELILDMVATLYRQIYDEESQTTIYVPALADGDPIAEDAQHRVWTIKVKDGYTFADGTPIDAYSVDYSMKMLNDPKLANRNVNASEFENGVNYMQGNCEWTEVGFKAIDKNTIKVTFAENHEPESAVDVRATFSFVATGVVHEKTYEACLNADRTQCSYGSSLETFVASGIYNPTKLIEGQYLELTKRLGNEAPLADVYTPDRVEYYVVSDANTAIQLFEQGKLDAVVANQPAYDEYPNAYFTYQPYNMGIYINGETPTSEILTDVNFRYALYWGLDREKIVKSVFPTSKASAYQYLSFATMPDPSDKENKKLIFRDTKEAKAIRMDGHEVTLSGYNLELANEYFNKAYEANGGKKIVINAIYTDASEISKTWSEALQQHYQTLFGEDRLEITLQAVPYSILYDEISREKMNYDLCLSAGWWNNAENPWNNSNWVYSGEYTFNTQYCVIADKSLAAEWDDLFYKCALYDWKWDAQKKLEATARMEEILYNDCCFIPAYSSGSRYFFSSKIEPILKVGNIDLGFCLMQCKFN